MASGGARQPFLLPSILVYAVEVPFVITALWVAVTAMIRAYSGPYSGMFEPGWWHWPALLAAPGAVLNAALLTGRARSLDALPDPTVRDAPPPPQLALPGGEDAALRPAGLPVRGPLGRRAADGVLFAGGASMLALALGMAVVQQENFDSILGLKLGGIWFHGTYWNRWWFVFYALGGTGAATTAAAMLLFIRRLNRKDG